MYVALALICNIFIIIIILNLGRSSRGGRQKLILEIIYIRLFHHEGSTKSIADKKYKSDMTRATGMYKNIKSYLTNTFKPTRVSKLTKYHIYVYNITHTWTDNTVAHHYHTCITDGKTLV